MPEITNANLTLTEADSQVTVNVEYDAVFKRIDRQLAGMGLVYHTHLTAHGVDRSVPGRTLPRVDFPQHEFAVTVGDTDQVFRNVVESVTVPRSALGEDPVGDPDEITVEILIHSPLPPIYTDPVFTDEEVLTSAG